MKESFFLQCLAICFVKSDLIFARSLNFGLFLKTLFYMLAVQIWDDLDHINVGVGGERPGGGWFGLSGERTI